MARIVNSKKSLGILMVGIFVGLTISIAIPAASAASPTLNDIMARLNLIKANTDKIPDVQTSVNAVGRPTGLSAKLQVAEGQNSIVVPAAESGLERSAMVTLVNLDAFDTKAVGLLL